jgi:hypothetical protein
VVIPFIPKCHSPLISAISSKTLDSFSLAGQGGQELRGGILPELARGGLHSPEIRRRDAILAFSQLEATGPRLDGRLSGIENLITRPERFLSPGIHQTHPPTYRQGSVTAENREAAEKHCVTTARFTQPGEKIVRQGVFAVPGSLPRSSLQLVWVQSHEFEPPNLRKFDSHDWLQGISAIDHLGSALIASHGQYGYPPDLGGQARA